MSHRRRIATFNPRRGIGREGANGHNYSKTAILLALGAHPSGMPAAAVAELAHVPLSTVKSSFSRWMRWRRPYCLRDRRTVRSGQTLYHYRLSARGYHFLTDRVPPPLLMQLQAELGVGAPRIRSAATGPVSSRRPMAPITNSRVPRLMPWSADDIANAVAVQVAAGWWLITRDGRRRFFAELPRGAGGD